MNRKTVALCLALLCLLGATLGAQEKSGYQKQDLYTKNFPIAKIFSSKYGYRVDYVLSNLDVRAVYIKLEHFTGAAGKAVLAPGRGVEYPYLSVTWVAGEIDHVTVYAVDNPGDLSWGVLRGDVEKDFPEDIVIKF